MWHGRVDARPSIRPTIACGHMCEDWHGAVAIPMTASCASSTAADAAPLCFVLFQRSSEQEKHSTLGSGAGDRATRAPHRTSHARTAQRAPVSTTDNLCTITFEHSAYIHTSSSSSSSSSSRSSCSSQCTPHRSILCSRVFYFRYFMLFSAVGTS